MRDEERETLKQISEIAGPFLDDAGADGLVVGSLRLIRTQGSRRTLQRELLLARGVAPDVIADCTKVSEYESLKVEAVTE